MVELLLEVSQPFFKNDQKEQFIRELYKVYNYENILENFLLDHFEWYERVEEKGTCYFLLEKVKVPSHMEVPGNILFLKILGDEKQPVLKVVTYYK